MCSLKSSWEAPRYKHNLMHVERVCDKLELLMIWESRVIDPVQARDVPLSVSEGWLVETGPPSLSSGLISTSSGALLGRIRTTLCAYSVVPSGSSSTSPIRAREFLSEVRALFQPCFWSQQWQGFNNWWNALKNADRTRWRKEAVLLVSSQEFWQGM